ncbi:tRNA lysidine(34) synthetase TilS [Psychromonas sp. B3M02]|uniref:tRNA lysidine(34) synthetase TilS n=1 Tax=Psychromonas sp. B3M02 TaxID=2267226 RepID=UPI000DE9662E|nr:tRNA lysidine(34) synthetase TilS [Psychromonas sp. B3M02]RBW47399.1 tRNA lysidine(34) synthetase TilS [Psychromonas sp. B3M02]
MQSEFNQALLNLLAELVESSAQPRLVVALSGGVDSVVLLRLLVQFQRDYPHYQVLAHNVNHGLSPHAEQWADFCEVYCASLNVKLLRSIVNIQKTSRNSLEALAREARYQCFSQHLQADDILLTGHHQDDQLETLLLALKRGSGSTGLQGIRAIQPFHNGHLVRPLLNFSRKQIIDYAETAGLKWVEDESNQDTDFDRNFIRHQITPLLTERWPAIASSASRTARLCQEQQGLVDEVAAQDLQQSMCVRLGTQTLSIAALVDLSQARRNNLLRYWLKFNGLDYPSSKQLTVLWQEVALAEQGKQPCLQLASNTIQRYQGELYIVPVKPLIIPDSPVTWSGEPLLWVSPDKLAVDFSMVDAALAKQHTISCCFRQHLDPKLTCLVEGRSKSRSIKKLLQESKVPTWQREQVVFIFIDGQLVQALGVWHCQPSPTRQLPKLNLSLRSI